MSVYLFKRVFKTSNINVDTVCSVYCQICNMVFAQLGDQVLDLEGKSKKDKSGGKDEKDKKTPGIPGGDEGIASRLANFAREAQDIILTNKVLKDPGAIFGPRRKIHYQLEYVK